MQKIKTKIKSASNAALPVLYFTPLAMGLWGFVSLVLWTS
tara:strand:- start:19904 stop:20023 length:120 start_codon:yes stop_codon:yes gene_type:complete